MMSSIDEWHDILRLVNGLICLWAIFVLRRRYVVNRNDWNTKTLDFWFALTFWSVAGLALSIEGVLRDSDPGPRLMFIAAASVVTLKALLRKGGWGSSAT